MRGIETLMDEGRRASISLTLTPRDALKGCPFCGGAGELHNTHTASYWIACIDCGAQAHGTAFGTDRSSDELAVGQHKRAKASAIAAWNRRTP